MNKNNIAINNGSVGKERLRAIPGTRSFSCIDKGVKNTTARNILSNDNKPVKIKSKITGKNAM